MLHVPLTPKDLDGALRVMVVARAVSDPSDLARQRLRLEQFVRSEYEWPVEVRTIASTQLRRVNLRKVERLLRTGDWDVLIVDSLDRLTRSRRRFFQFMA